MLLPFVQYTVVRLVYRCWSNNIIVVRHQRMLLLFLKFSFVRRVYCCSSNSITDVRQNITAVFQVYYCTAGSL